MKCYDCGCDLTRGDQFCKQCGRDLRPKGGAHRDAKSRDNRAPRAPALTFPNQECTDAWKAAIDTHVKASRKTWRILSVFPLAAGLWVLLSFGHGYQLNEASGILFLVAFAMFFYASRELSQAEYTRIPYTMTTEGRIRCIHCGNAGIYTHGVYKTNKKVHDCSKCKVTLFVS